MKTIPSLIVYIGQVIGLFTFVALALFFTGAFDGYVYQSAHDIATTTTITDINGEEITTTTGVVKIVDPASNPILNIIFGVFIMGILFSLLTFDFIKKEKSPFK